MSRFETVRVALTPELERVVKARPSGVTPSSYILELAIEGSAAREKKGVELLNAEAIRSETQDMISQCRDTMQFNKSATTALVELIEKLNSNINDLSIEVQKTAAALERNALVTHG